MKPGLFEYLENMGQRGPNGKCTGCGAPFAMGMTHGGAYWTFMPGLGWRHECDEWKAGSARKGEDNGSEETAVEADNRAQEG